jgi:tetratricopeptide (TPR) repeat protein
MFRGMDSISKVTLLALLGLLSSISCVTAKDVFAAQQDSTPQSDRDPRVQARQYLNDGVRAYKEARFDEAIDDFKKSKELDPLLENASLYLATTYATQYIPGAPSRENVHYGALAVLEFREILAEDPNNLSAIDGIASILYNVGSAPFEPVILQESKSYHQKHIAIEADDPEPYYWVGVIDWALCYAANKGLRDQYNSTAANPLKAEAALPPGLSANFDAECRATVDEGMANLQTAIRLRPDYDDAMAYLNLLYRQKADTEPSKTLRDEDVQKADDLVDQVKAIKRKRMENQTSPQARP